MKKTQRLTQLTLELLAYFGNKQPSEEQVNIMRVLITENILISKLLYVEKLTDRDIACLFLAAAGQSIEETAIFLQLSEETVKKYRKDIIKKLNCRTLLQAAFTVMHPYHKLVEMPIINKGG